jgi:hypothetical protein
MTDNCSNQRDAIDMGLEPSEQQEPKVESSGGGSGKPRRPTAIGLGGRGDGAPDSSELISSWPLPDLTFVRIDGVRVQQGNQQKVAERHDPSPVPKRMHLMEDALIGLHSQTAYVAFLVLGNKGAVNYYLGTSVPSPENYPNADTTPSATSCESLKCVLQSVYAGINICEQPFPADAIKAMVTPLAQNIGVVTGIPSLQSNQIEKLAAGLCTHEFGFLILAVPVPIPYVNREEFSVMDQIERARTSMDQGKVTHDQHYFALQESYLRNLQLATTIGAWQVGGYYFARDRSIFIRLESLIRVTYLDTSSHLPLIRTHEMKGLKPHVEQFGLLINQRANDELQTLRSYRYLTPLKSRNLSAYVHLPKHEMPGFRIAGAERPKS